jgi:hypothetical protein
MVDFAVLVPPDVTKRALEEPAALAEALATAQAVTPRWLVLQTGHDVGPSGRVRARLQALGEHAKSDTWRIAWEPRGPFEADVAREWCEALGITFVEDLSQFDGANASTVYTRLRAEGAGARLTAGALERLAEQISGAEEVWVVVEGRGHAKARSRVRRAIESVVGLESDADDAGEDGDSDGAEEFDDELEGAGESDDGAGEDAESAADEDEESR